MIDGVALLLLVERTTATNPAHAHCHGSHSNHAQVQSTHATNAPRWPPTARRMEDRGGGRGRGYRRMSPGILVAVSFDGILGERVEIYRSSAGKISAYGRCQSSRWLQLRRGNQEVRDTGRMTDESSDAHFYSPQDPRIARSYDGPPNSWRLVANGVRF
jgi:hypothetical protein